MKQLFSGFVDVLRNIGYYYGHVLYKFVPKPEYQLSTQYFGWREFKSYLRPRHIVAGFVSVAIALSLVIWLIFTFNFMGISMVGAIAILIKKSIETVFGIPFGELPTAILSFGILSLLLALNNKSMTKEFRGEVVGSGISSWAMKEELAFRAGAENWTFWERARSAMSFGAIHYGNLFFPFAAVFASAWGGFLYTAIYLYHFKRTGSVDIALKESASVHTVHNLIAFSILGIALITLPIVLIIELFV